MRPDYTLSLWPDACTQAQAEEMELITHVHFDAKYKVDSLDKLFGAEDGKLDLDKEKAEQRKGNYNRADLLKMHAYRDAIRRSAGAYVLYPGTEADETSFQGFHELLPGLGAFPLRPNDGTGSGLNDGSKALAGFLREVVAHVCNRASQYEQQSYHTYDIHKDDPPSSVKERVNVLENGYRVKPVKETYAIYGWVEDGQLDWVKKSKLYNFRTGSGQGSLHLHSTVTGASYILLRGKGQNHGGGTLMRIVSKGPRILPKERLVELGYPGRGSQPYYLVFEVEALESDDPLAKYDWDLAKISGVELGRRSGVPPKEGISLNEFMKGCIKR